MLALDNPEALESLHRDFQHAGSDVVQAFTYNGHREKMRVINKEHLLEPLNRAALRIARKCADNPPKGLGISLMAGNISNSNIWEQDNKRVQNEVRSMFAEMYEKSKEIDSRRSKEKSKEIDSRYSPEKSRDPE